MIKIIKNIENQLKKDFKPSSLTVIDNTHLHKKHKNFKKLTNKSDKTIFGILNGKIVDKKGRNVISYGDIIKTGTLKKLSEIFKIKKQLTILRVYK